MSAPSRACEIGTELHRSRPAEHYRVETLRAAQITAAHATNRSSPFNSFRRRVSRRSGGVGRSRAGWRALRSWCRKYHSTASQRRGAIPLPGPELDRRQGKREARRAARTQAGKPKFERDSGARLIEGADRCSLPSRRGSRGLQVTDQSEKPPPRWATTRSDVAWPCGAVPRVTTGQLRWSTGVPTVAGS